MTKKKVGKEMSNWKKELEISKQAALAAGQAIMQIYGSDDYGIEYKGDYSPLTIADKKANQIIVSMLREYFKDYAILSEEEKDDRERLHNDYCFIVDPLDGTKEFIKRNGQFTVNIALAYKGKIVVGVIYAPVSKELYWAMQGLGAFLESEGVVKPIGVSDRKDDIRVVMSNSHGCSEMDELLRKNNLTHCVKMGSSLKGCMIAKGDAEIYYRFNPTMEWDTAAMQCIVEEAGGIFCQMDDTPMIYNRSDCVNRKGFYIINHVDNKVKQ